MKSIGKKIIMLISCAVLIVIDQLTKNWASTTLQDKTSIDFIKGFIDFRYVENRGMAFGLLQNHRWMFIIPTVIIVLVCLYFVLIKSQKSLLLNLTLVLILSGGIGNLIDRLMLGYVVDFINFTFVNFYVFNLADCFCVVSVALISLYFLVEAFKEKKANG